VIPADKLLALTDLIYHFTQANFHEWDDEFMSDKFKDVQVISNVIRESKLGINDVERFDLVNLYQVNLVRMIL